MQPIYLFLAYFGQQHYVFNISKTEKIYLLEWKEEFFQAFQQFQANNPILAEVLPSDLFALEEALVQFLNDCELNQRNENPFFLYATHFLSEPKLKELMDHYTLDDHRFLEPYGKAFYRELYPLSTISFSSSMEPTNDVQMTYSVRPYRSFSVSRKKS